MTQVLGPVPGNCESLLLGGTLHFRSSPSSSDDCSGLGTMKLAHILREDGHVSSTTNYVVQVYF